MAQQLNPENFTPLTPTDLSTGAHGPVRLDPVTLERVADHFTRGIFTPVQDVEKIVAEYPQDDFDRIFGGYLGASPLSSAADIFEHRALALERTVMQISEEHNTAAKRHVSVDTLRISEDDLTAYLTNAAVHLENVSPELAPLLLETAQFVTPTQLAKMTGLQEGTLAVWRSTTGSGPRYVKMDGKRPSIRYPVVAVLEWVRVLRSGS